MKLHVKIGTHPAEFIMIKGNKPPKIGDELEFIKDNRIVTTRCYLIKNLCDDDILYYLELW